MSHQSRFTRYAAGLTILFLASPTLPTFAAPQEDAAPLFLDTGAPVAPLPAHAKGTRGLSVRVNHDALKQPALIFDLLGESVTVTRERLVEDGKGSFTWVGHIEGEPGSEVILTLRGQAVTGAIHREGKLYELSATAQGRSVLFEVDEEGLPPDAHEAAPPDTSAGEEAVAAASGGAVVHDLMVVYTPVACNRYGRDANGGCSALESMIQNAVTAANQAYLNSQVNLQLNLVHTAEVAYTESGNDMTKSLYDLTNTGGNYSAMDVVQGWRNTHGADLVSLITEDSNYCGIAWLMNGSSSYGYSVVYSSCLSSQTLAHELGHNQGDHHDRANADSGYYPYSYGYRQCVSGGFRTVMAYPCSYNGNGVGTTRISNFSNPAVYYNGQATGINHDTDPANSADNARSMNNTASTVAAFRASVATTPPAAPSGLTAAAQTYSSIQLNWADNADDESGFKVERALVGGTWSEIASLSANTTGFLNTGLNSETTYQFRVSAYNGAGSSAASNVATADTPVRPATVNDVATGEIKGAGTVTGTYSATQADDGAAEAIKEIQGGPRKNPYSYLQHTWTFNVAGGTKVTLFANAYSGGSTDGDAFNFSYSIDGINFIPLFTVSLTSSGNSQWADLPATTQGLVYIRVADSKRSKGNTVNDTVYVDHLYIQSQP